MKTINLFHPISWSNFGHWSYYNHTEDNYGKWQNFRFRINEARNKISSGIIVVHEDVDYTIELSSKDQLAIFVTGEAESNKNYSQKFLNQFDIIITSRKDIVHASTIRAHYLHPWQIKKTYSELVNIRPNIKNKHLSAIISNSTFTEGHKKRFAFINMLKGHFKEELEWFSKGTNFIEDKWEGLFPYEYSIAIENSSHNNYFTEKISDCFLAYTMPIYFGCPNINEYFDERSMINIDIKDFQGSVEKIESALQKDLYKKNYRYILESRRLVLEKYHFVAGLSNLLENLNHLKREKIKKRKIRPQLFFQESSLFRTITKAIYLFK